MRRRCRKFARLAAGGRWIRTIGPPYYGALREWRVLRHFRGELVGDFEVPAFRRDAVDDAGLGGAKYWALLNFRGAAAFATEVTLTGRFFTAEEALAVARGTARECDCHGNSAILRTSCLPPTRTS
jgi:hypothetical protein